MVHHFSYCAWSQDHSRVSGLVVDITSSRPAPLHNGPLLPVFGGAFRCTSPAVRSDVSTLPSDLLLGYCRLPDHSAPHRPASWAYKPAFLPGQTSFLFSSLMPNIQWLSGIMKPGGWTHRVLWQQVRTPFEAAWTNFLIPPHGQPPFFIGFTALCGGLKKKPSFDCDCCMLGCCLAL